MSATSNRPGRVNGAIIEADGTVTPFPTTLGAPGEILDFGDKIVVTPGSAGTQIETYSLTDHRWSTLRVPVAAGGYTRAMVAGSVLVVVSQEFVESETGLGPARVDLVQADGSVAAGALPADLWGLPRNGPTVVWTGHDVVVYGADTSAFSTNLTHVTAFDPVANTYRSMSNPQWVTCGAGCGWSSQHQGGDHQFAVWTGTRSLVFTSVNGSEFTALHDPVGDVWERIPDPPVPLSQPWVEASGRFITVFATNAGPTHLGSDQGPIPATLGLAAVLDTQTRTWSTAQFANPATPDTSGWSLCPVRLDPTLVVSTCPEMGNPITPMALDPATGQWSPATDRQLHKAFIGLGAITLDQLDSALNA